MKCKIGSSNWESNSGPSHVQLLFSMCSTYTQQNAHEQMVANLVMQFTVYKNLLQNYQHCMSINQFSRRLTQKNECGNRPVLQTTAGSQSRAYSLETENVSQLHQTSCQIRLDAQNTPVDQNTDVAYEIMPVIYETIRICQVTTLEGPQHTFQKPRCLFEEVE